MRRLSEPRRDDRCNERPSLRDYRGSTLPVTGEAALFRPPRDPALRSARDRGRPAHARSRATSAASRPKQVLEILLAARGHRVPTERIAELLWGDGATEGRRRLDPDLRLGAAPASRPTTATAPAGSSSPRPRRTGFATDLVDLDLDRFDELLERAARRADAARAPLARAGARRSRAARCSKTSRTRAGRRICAAPTRAACSERASTRPTPRSPSVDYRARARARAGGDPRSTASASARSATQMLALYALGRQHDALDAYRSFRRRLDDELGLEPTPETRALEAAILRQDDVRSLLPRPIVHETQRRRETGPCDCSGGPTSSRHSTARSAAALDGSCALIVVEGEAGIGKTRLLDELADTPRRRTGRAREHARNSNGTCRTCRSEPRLREALAGIDDRRRATARASRRILPELDPGRARRASPTSRCSRRSSSWSPSTHRSCSLLDDLQWADPATIGALSYLQRRCAGRAARDRRQRSATSSRRIIRPAGSSPTYAVRLAAADGRRPRAARNARPARVDGRQSRSSSPRRSQAAARPAARGRARRGAARPLPRRRTACAYRILLTASVLEQPFEPEPLADVARHRRRGARRGARAAVRTPDPPRRRPPLPLPLRARPRRAPRQPLARTRAHPPCATRRETKLSRRASARAG